MIMHDAFNRRVFLKHTGLALGAAVVPAIARGKPAVRTGLVIGHPQAAETGNDMLAAGGNAVDAAVAAALAAAVVAVPGTGIAGYGGHLVVAKSDGNVAAIDFNTTAPAALKTDTFPADERGNVKGDTNSFGWLAVGVPGVLAGMQRSSTDSAAGRSPTPSNPRFASPATVFLSTRASPMPSRPRGNDWPAITVPPGSSVRRVNLSRKGQPIATRTSPTCFRRLPTAATSPPSTKGTSPTKSPRRFRKTAGWSPPTTWRHIAPLM